jgi:hypothetical protein
MSAQVRYRAIPLLAAVLLAACGGSGGSGGAAVSTPTASSTQAPLVFPMNGVGAHAAISGTVTILRRGDGSGFKVKIDITGGDLNSSHVSHIHAGSCAKNGPIAIPFPNNVLIDAAGRGLSTNDIDKPYVVPADGWYANVHTGADLTNAANAVPYACGDLHA